MTDADLLPPDVLKRKAVVYVRQSTQAQVQLNLESQRRQYELVDEARRRGFRDRCWAKVYRARRPEAPGCGAFFDGAAVHRFVIISGR